MISVRQSSRESISGIKNPIDSQMNNLTNDFNLHLTELPKLEDSQIDSFSEQSNENSFLKQNKEESYEYLYENQEEGQTSREKRIEELKIILEKQMNEIKQIEKQVLYLFIYFYYLKSHLLI